MSQYQRFGESNRDKLQQTRWDNEVKDGALRRGEVWCYACKRSMGRRPQARLVDCFDAIHTCPHCGQEQRGRRCD